MCLVKARACCCDLWAIGNPTQGAIQHASSPPGLGAYGTRSDLAGLILAVTNIGPGILEGKKDPHKVSIYERLSWAAYRHTTRWEDRSYCLLGLFNVAMPLL